MRLLVLALMLAACVREPSPAAGVSPAPRLAPGDAARSRAAPSVGVPDAAASSMDAGAPVAAACDGSDQRLFGTTCCTFDNTPDDERSPGMEIGRCDGPQIGKPCRRAGDCDVTCSCDARYHLLRPSDDPQGPADGTRGVVGWCSGSIRIGVWTCEIDGTGAVSHRIID